MKRRVLLAVALSCSTLSASDVLAHAFLDHARPAVGSTVHGSPAQLKLWFTQRLEPAFSAAQVLDHSGKRVDKADARVDASDATVLLLSLPPLAPGTYRVTWRVLSVDTHVTEGDFTFDVAP
jgi:methionine-rich copper-binding protein CopC